MKKIIIPIIVIAMAIVTSCTDNKKAQEALKITQDSLRTDSIFKRKIAALEYTSDSLLSYSERKAAKQKFAEEYREMIAEMVRERAHGLHLEKDVESSSYLAQEVFTTIKRELEQEGYDQKSLEKRYLDWEREHSKNVVMQRFTDEELGKVKADYVYFKQGIK